MPRSTGPFDIAIPIDQDANQNLPLYSLSLSLQRVFRFNSLYDTAMP
jgi:hypothetical protein